MKTAGQLAADRERLMGAREWSTGTKALLAQEAAGRRATLAAGREAKFAVSTASALAQAPAVIRAQMEAKGYQPVLRGGQVAFVKPGSGGIPATVSELTRKFGDQALGKLLPKAGWKKYIEVPGGDDYYAQYENGQIVDVRSRDELSDPETRAIALQASSGGTMPTFVDASQIEQTVAATQAQQAELDAQLVQGDIFHQGLSGYSDTVKYVGVIAAVGLLAYALWVRHSRKG